MCDSNETLLFEIHLGAFLRAGECVDNVLHQCVNIPLELMLSVYPIKTCEQWKNLFSKYKHKKYTSIHIDCIRML